MDKIPYVDSTWDAVHTAVRPTIGAVLGVLITSENSNLGELAGGSTGGGTALLAHTVKAGFRLGVNLSPEPVSNFLVSVAEDAAVLAVVLLSVATPWVAAAISAVLLAFGLWVVGVTGVYARRLWRTKQIGARRRGPPT